GSRARSGRDRPSRSRSQCVPSNCQRSPDATSMVLLALWHASYRSTDGMLRAMPGGAQPSASAQFPTSQGPDRRGPTPRSVAGAGGKDLRDGRRFLVTPLAGALATPLTADAQVVQADQVVEC